MEKTPLFYWPTTLMLVDDNLSFLENISFKLGNKLPRVLYQNPLKALKVLYGTTTWVDKAACFIEPVNSNELDEDTSTKKLNYQALINLVYEKTRFSAISTVLLDYSMPKLDGISFCRKIKNLPLKKIILTGEASNDLAVSAFNEGIIDNFMIKDIDSIMEQLNSSIGKMQQAYFSGISLGLIGSSMDEFKRNKAYLQIFSNFIRDNAIEEYYQIDHYGSYLGLDNSGCAHWLVIRSEDSFNEALDIVKHGGDQNNLSKQLQEKSHLLFLFSEAEKKLPISSWNNFLFPVAESFSFAGKPYYCTTIHREIFSLERKRMMSFQNYMEKGRLKNIKPVIAKSIFRRGNLVFSR